MPHRPPIHRPERAHAAKPSETRETAAQRGYGARWQRYRVTYLSRPENAVCVECRKQGVATPPTVIDHIKPHKGDERLFWDPSNHQPLCETHHNRKTATEDGGFGRGKR